MSIDNKVHPAKVNTKKRLVYRDDTNPLVIKDYLVEKCKKGRGGKPAYRYDKSSPLGGKDEEEYKEEVDEEGNEEGDTKSKSPYYEGSDEEDEAPDWKNVKLNQCMQSQRASFMDNEGDVEVTEDNLYTVYGYQVESRYHDDDNLRNPNVDKNDGVVKVTFRYGSEHVFTIFCNLLTGKSSEDAYEAAKGEDGAVRVMGIDGKLSPPLNLDNQVIAEQVDYNTRTYSDEENNIERRVYVFDVLKKKWTHDKDRDAQDLTTTSPAASAPNNLPSEEEQVRGHYGNVLPFYRLCTGDI